MLTSFGIHRAELRSSLKTFAGDFFSGVSVFITPKSRSRKLRPLEMNKERGLNSSQSYHRIEKMFYGNAMFIGNSRGQQPERIEIFIFSGLSLSGLVDTKLTSI